MRAARRTSTTQCEIALARAPAQRQFICKFAFISATIPFSLTCPPIIATGDVIEVWGTAVLGACCGGFVHSFDDRRALRFSPGRAGDIRRRTTSCMGLRRVSSDNSFLRVDIAEVIWRLVNGIPILRGGFDFSRSNFDRVDGARIGWEVRRRPLPPRLPFRLRSARMSDAVCFIRLFGVGRRFLLFRSAVQKTRCAMVACHRRLHRVRHAD